MQKINYKIGDTFHLFKGLLPTYKCHVVGIVDEDMIVYKWYGRHKQWWHYEVEPAYLLDITIPQTKKIIKENQCKK